MVDLAIISTLISPLIVIACLCVGFVLKYAIPNEKINHFIPLIVMLLGIGANIWAVGAVTLETCVAGAVSGLASTGLYEAFSQIIGLTIEDKSKDAKHAAEEENKD